MTQDEFKNQYGLKFRDDIEETSFFNILDDLYLCYTKEQVIAIVEMFYDHADEIYNDRHSRLLEGTNRFVSPLDPKSIDKVKKD